MHVIAAKAVAFGEAMTPEFKNYAQLIIENAKVMAEELLTLGYELVSGGTDTHVLLIDLTNKGITGKHAENILGKSGITLNKNMVPFDSKSPFITSGIRVGTPAITTRNMGSNEMKKIASFINTVVTDADNDDTIQNVKSQVKELCDSFPIYEESSH